MLSIRTIQLALAFALFNVAFISAEEPLDYSISEPTKTHLPHLNSSSGGGGVSGAQAPSGSANSTGSYTGSITIVQPTSTPPEAEEHISVAPSNPQALFAAISDFSLRGGSNTTKCALSLAAGAPGTWSQFFVPLVNNNPATFDPATGNIIQWPYNSDPVTAIDLDGNVYLADLYFHSENGNNSNGLYVAVGSINQPDLGLSAASVYPVATNLSPSTNISEDKEWIAVDNSLVSSWTGNVYVSWTRFVGNSNTIYFSESSNHGLTWSAPLRISPVAQDGAVQGSQIAVGPAGEIYIVYEVFYTSNRRRQFMALSTTGGQSFSAPVAISPVFNELTFNSTYRKNSFAAIAVHPAGGLCVAYADQPNSTVGAQLEFISSITSNGNFSAPIVVNDNAVGQQFMPALAVDSAGTIHASWFDTRNNPKRSNYYDIYAAKSTDNGKTFLTNNRVTPALIYAGNANFIGDYMGEAAANGYAYPVWTSGGFNGGLLSTAALH